MTLDHPPFGAAVLGWVNTFQKAEGPLEVLSEGNEGAEEEEEIKDTTPHQAEVCLCCCSRRVGEREWLHPALGLGRG